MTPDDARPARLHCPKCASIYVAEVVLDHCDVSWPQQRWLGFTCPACDAFFHVEVEPGRLTLGGIDGAPGPAFFPDHAAEVPGLRVEARFGGITVRLGTRTWRVKGKR
jgi:hypothetical protein